MTLTDAFGQSPFPGTGGYGSVEAVGQCGWCSDGINLVWHSGVCPKVQEIEYYPNGAIKRVVFK